MHWTRRKKILVSILLVIALGAGAAWLLTRPEPPDTRFNGAYRLDDGRVALVAPRVGETLRIRFPESGESRALYPVGERGELRYEAGPGWSDREPVEWEVRFEMREGGRSGGFVLIPRGETEGPQRTAERIDLREEVFTFASGELSLRAKLVLPPEDRFGGGSPPVVIPVHGSGDGSAVDTWSVPYLFAAHGIATLVYDKRGTGGSDGAYTQNFHVLARDTVAALEAVRARPEIDPENLHLAGYSQGGWIAPLAAAEDGGVRSLLINYGPMVPIAEEDRWGYVYRLRRRGFGDEAIREADRLHEIFNRIVREDEGAWDDLGVLLEQSAGEDWFEAAEGSDSTVGFLADNRMPLWVLRLYAWWRLRPVDGEPFAERFYDPVPTVASLDVPSLWIFGGEDESMPTAWSIDELERLQRTCRPIEILLYPEADHGILRFEEGEDGERRYLGYEPTYMPTQVAWLRDQSGLDPVPDLPAR